MGVVAIPCSMGLLMKITIKGSVKNSKKNIETHAFRHAKDNEREEYVKKWKLE